MPQATTTLAQLLDALQPEAPPAAPLAADRAGRAVDACADDLARRCVGNKGTRVSGRDQAHSQWS